MKSIYIAHLQFCFFGLLILSAKGFAEEAPQDSHYLLSEQTYQILADVHTMIEKEDYQEALATLHQLRPKSKGNNYELAVIDQNLGYVYHVTGDYPKAIAAFESAIRTNALPSGVTHSLTYNLAQLLIYTKMYQDGLQYLNTWLKNETAPPPDAHILATSAYYQLEQYDEAIPHAETAVQQAEQPNESWYQLLLACYYQRSQYKNAAALLEEMIIHFPKKRSYWLQLTGMYQRLKRDERALAVLELAYSQDMLDEEELLRLAQLYLYMQLPYKAGQLLATEIEQGRITKSKQNWELLANSWLLAQEMEQAANALQQAAQLADDSALFYRLGRIYVDLEQWDEAIAALQASTNSGELDDLADAYLFLGIAAYRKGDHKLAMKAFKKAITYDKTQTQADQWLQQLVTEAELAPTDSTL